MISALDSMPQGGAIGCKLSNPDGSLQTTSVQSFPTVLNQLLALSWLQRRWPALPIWGKQALYSTEPNTVHQVDFVSGAAILVKREVFEAVGGFNPEYFMYAEEADLCFAIHRAGYSVLHTGDARITHFGGQSTKSCDDDFAAVTMRDSVYRFLRRNRGSSYAILYRLALFASAFVRLTILCGVFPFAVFFGYPITREDVSRPFRKWLKISQWTLGSEPNSNRLAATPETSAAPAEN
jgi:GT2 family glycosyltransferase